MAEQIPADEQSNYETFRDCLGEPVLRALTVTSEKSGPKKKRHAKRSSKGGSVDLSKKSAEKTESFAAQNDAEDLGDFIDACPPPQNQFERTHPN